MAQLGWPERHAHRMNDLQWIYNDHLAELGNFQPLPKVYENLYAFVRKRRSSNILGYRKDKYSITDEKNFQLIS